MVTGGGWEVTLYCHPGSREMNELSSLSLSNSVHNSSPGNSTIYIQGGSPHLSLHSLNNPLTGVPRGLWSVELTMLTIIVSLHSPREGLSSWKARAWLQILPPCVTESRSFMCIPPQ